MNRLIRNLGRHACIYCWLLLSLSSCKTILEIKNFGINIYNYQWNNYHETDILIPLDGYYVMPTVKIENTLHIVTDDKLIWIIKCPGYKSYLRTYYIERYGSFTRSGDTLKLKVDFEIENDTIFSINPVIPNHKFLVSGDSIHIELLHYNNQVGQLFSPDSGIHITHLGKRKVNGVYTGSLPTYIKREGSAVNKGEDTNIVQHKLILKKNRSFIWISGTSANRLKSIGEWEVYGNILILNIQFYEGFGSKQKYSHRLVKFELCSGDTIIGKNIPIPLTKN